ncbi:glycosyltransferase [Methylobacterium sp. E-041]|uniref:glycosyltransferase family 2 protein n=1 Tax=Methylobacterium sp. E-041 TaxID=2836573 RepID=UPI001FB9BAA3|nr:glycosyltransferase [Methylobacterium sp. E-041]MCJ2108526.1 glycosyltransferase [Methylobacterium sp. E-041]
MQKEINKVVASVVIPTYNSQETLARAIRSVQNQSLSDIEILIVNDCSSDESLQIARDFSVSDSRIYIIDLKSNSGKSAAMNAAIAAASGEWIAVLDADDTYEKERLERLIGMAIKEDVDLVADNQRHIDPEKESAFSIAFQAQGIGRHLSSADFAKYSSSSSKFDFGILKPIVKKDFISSTVLKYNEGARFAEDFYYLFDFFAAGGRAYISHAPYYNWYMPFSPSSRKWSTTGNGAWRYDYRIALSINSEFKSTYKDHANKKLYDILLSREAGYKKMIHYIDAQKLFEKEKNYKAALAIIIFNPNIWPLFIKRVGGRVWRFILQNVSKR